MYKTNRFYAFIQDLLGIVFKTKMRFFGQFRDFLQLFLLLFLAIFRRETLPSLANETNSNGENFRFFETKSAIFAVYILFFLTFSHRETLFFDKFFGFSTLQKIQKWKIFRFFIFLNGLNIFSYIKIYILFEKRTGILINFFFYDSLFHKFR